LLWRCGILLQEEKRSKQDGGDHWNEKLKSFNCVQEELMKLLLWTHVAAVAEKEDGDARLRRHGGSSRCSKQGLFEKFPTTFCFHTQVMGRL
jgi:hypothetical protein